jgi:hypothetical protein
MLNADPLGTGEVPILSGLNFKLAALSSAPTPLKGALAGIVEASIGSS